MSSVVDRREGRGEISLFPGARVTRVTTGIVCFPALASLHGVSYVRFPTYVPCAFGKRLFPFPFYVPFHVAIYVQFEVAFSSTGSPKNLEQVSRIGQLLEASPRAQQAAEAFGPVVLARALHPGGYGDRSGYPGRVDRARPPGGLDRPRNWTRGT